MATENASEKTSSSRPKIIMVGGGHKKHEDHGSHGAWKIAYADFMTAMMAFFLMMWLTSSVSENVRRGISTYFAPIGASTNIFGTDALLEGGENLDILGNLQNMTLENQIFPDTPVYDLSNDQQGDGKQKGGATDTSPSNSSHRQSQEIVENVSKAGGSSLSDKKAESGNNKSDKDSKGGIGVGEDAYKKTLGLIKEAIDKDATLTKFKDNIVTQIMPDGLKIELIDKKRLSMFEVGSSSMLPEMKMVLSKLGTLLSILPHHITITGHTDARAANDTIDKNWDLSALRALAAREVLVASSYPSGKIESVVAKASTEPYDPSDPMSPSNRRISILIMGVDPSSKDNGAN